MTKRMVFFLWVVSLLLLSGIGHALTVDEICQQKNLSPEQCQLLKSRFSSTGGQITPEALEALKQSPEFGQLKPEDIQKGKELLEKAETLESRKQAREKAGSPVVPRPAISEEGRTKTLFERVRQKAKYQDISLDLKPFGYEFFQDAAIQVITDRKDIPVPANYVVGPGDEVKIMLWGRVNAQHNLTVDRDGKIAIPQIGPLFVAGMTFEQMSKHIISQTTQVVGANIDITLGALKTIPVFVLGDVRRPGAYTIGSFATITDALLLAGGPNDIGSMRNVQLKRRGRLLTTFDLYNLLLKGDKSKDLILQAGDVVFVPVTGPLVGIAGNVKRPAIYELKDRFDLGGLFELAGGIIPSADTQQIQVSRIQRNERHIVIDIDDRDLKKSRTVRLQDADLIKVFSIVDRDRNAVYLGGNIKRPGKYQFKKGMKVGDLIRNSDDLLDETYYEYALIKRIKLPDRKEELVPFNLGKMLMQHDPAHNVELHPEDRVYVFSRWFFSDKPYVTVEGEVRGQKSSVDEFNENDDKRRSDRSPSSLDSSSLKNGGPGTSESQFQAEGDKVGDGENDNSKDANRVKDMDLALKQFSMVEDELKKAGKYLLMERVRVIKGTLINHQGTATRDILDLKDELKRMNRYDLEQRVLDATEALKTECRVMLSEKMKVRDAILKAGGLTLEAYRGRGEIIRVSEGRLYKTLYFNVEKAMANDPRENVVLQNRDRIVVHSVWEQAEEKSVAIDGEVKKPGSYLYTEQMTVNDLVFRAGQPMESAYLDEAELVSVSVEDGKKAKLVRKTISLRKALDGDPRHNVLLKNHDRLFVKRISDWDLERYATVAGEFRFPGRYIISKGEKLSSLIERAGGFTDTAYPRGAFFTRERVREQQQKGIEEMISRLERDIFTGGARDVATSLSASDLAAKQAELDQKRRFIQSLKETRASGRMAIQADLLKLIGSEYDIDLEDGDRLHIPEKNNVVTVVGSVMSTGSYIHESKNNYEDYIAMAGGYSRYADKRNVFVLKANGSAGKVGSGGFLYWNNIQSRWQLGSFNKIEPGDQIVVPEQIERIAWLREFRDITAILMNIAVTAGVVIKVF